MKLVEKLKNDYLKILAGLLVVCIVLEWFSGVRASLSIEQRTTPKVPPAIKKVAPPKEEKNHISVKVELFGDYVPSGVDAAGVKRSSLNVTVVGIFFDPNEKRSHVILELPGHQAKMFHVGDTVPGGAVIKRITPDGVLFMRDGAMESLSLPKNELFFSPPEKALKHES